MLRREIEIYLTNEIKWSTKGDLVVKLYDGAIRSLDIVLDTHHTRSEALRHQELGRVVGILVELEAALDPSSAEDLALTLARLYRTMRRQVVESSESQDHHTLRDVREQLSELRTAWEEVARKTYKPRIRRLVDRRRSRKG